MLVIWVYIISVGTLQYYRDAKNDNADEDISESIQFNAQQTLRNIKIVKALGQEKYEIQKVNDALEVGEEQVNKEAFLTGVAKGLFETCVYFVGAFSLSIGGIFIVSSIENINTNDIHTVGDIVAASGALQLGAIMIVVALNHLRSILKAKANSHLLHEIFESVPELTENKSTYVEVTSIDSDISVQNVTSI